MSAPAPSSGPSRCSGASSSFNPLLTLPKPTLKKKAKLIFVNVCDEVPNSSSTCIVLNTNSVSYKNYGRVSSIVEKYPYADVAGLRQPSEKIHFYARKEDRHNEGEAVVCTPPIYSEGPVVVTLISQYGIGRPVDENRIAKKMIEKCPEVEVRLKLKADTEKKRISNFKKCVENLKVKLEKNEEVKKIIFPVGISRSGNADPCWLCEYLPIIHDLANDMSKLKKEVLIATSETYMKMLVGEYAKKKALLKNAFEGFQNLEVVKEEDFDLDATIEYQVLDVDDDDDGDSQSMSGISKYFKSFHNC